jgi:MATE family multidrug resistance protein
MKSMIKLTLPIVLGSVGILTMGLVDLLMVGRVGAVAIGAMGLANSIFAWVMVFGIGMLTGLDYLVSFHHGAGRRELAFRAFAQGIRLTLWMGVPLTLGLWIFARDLSFLHLNPEVGVLVGPVLRTLALGMTPVFCFVACRQYLQALGVTFPTVFAMIGANLLNAIFNWVLIFGKWGCPARGEAHRRALPELPAL